MLCKSMKSAPCVYICAMLSVRSFFFSCYLFEYEKSLELPTLQPQPSVFKIKEAYVRMTKTIRSPSGNQTEVISSFREHIDTSPLDHGSLSVEEDEDLDELEGGVSIALPIIGQAQEPAMDYLLALISEDSSDGDSTTEKLRRNANSTDRENYFVNWVNHDTNEDNNIDTISPTFINTRRKRLQSDDTQPPTWHPPMALREQHDAFQPATTDGQSLTHEDAATASSNLIVAEDGIHKPDHAIASTSDDIAGPAARKMKELVFIRNPSRRLYPVEPSSDVASGSLASPSMLDSFAFIISVWSSESPVGLSGPAITEALEILAIITIQAYVSSFSCILCSPLMPCLLSL